jgi:RHS repeat-associated protein
MKEPSENKNVSSSFLKTDGGKTKSNAIEVPSINLPKGGGAMKGIDEKFSVNAVNGTSSLSIPLPVSPARGALPQLSLSYNSGSGNSIFGLGWNLGLPSIRRKTDKGLPQYQDAFESDVFLFSEAEDLVPAFKKATDGSFLKDANDNYVFDEKDSPDGLWVIRLYRPRIEGLFARIERWQEKSSNTIRWRVITKENTTTLFGWTTDARIADPADPRRVFEWLPELVFDDKGNCSQYIYKKEDDKGFDPALLHHRNRKKGGQITYTNTYLSEIWYGNKTSFLGLNNPFPAFSDFMFKTVLDYGEYQTAAPFQKTNDWVFRPDAFSDYKAGFEIRTTRLCQRVLLFHHFADLPGGSALIKSLNFEYDTNAEQDFTFLKTITSVGYLKKSDGTYSQKSLPPIEFDYQKHDWNTQVKSISPENLFHAPVGLDESQYQFTDLFNEGLSGILTEQAGGWYYKHNLGEGNFAPAKLVSPKPSFAGLGGGSLQLADLDADGGKQLAATSGEMRGYFELSDDDEWQPFRTFDLMPNRNFGDAFARMLDLNGDGKPELLLSEDGVFTWYESSGRKGFTAARRTVMDVDEESGPALVFSDPKQTIFLADMSGDGLTDLVRIRNGEVCYWPNLGYGRFGAKVGMDKSPVFDHPEAFNAAYLELADLDGSGTTDLVYLGKNKFTCWLNLSGNRFSAAPFEIPAFPEIHNLAKISVADLLGNGVACIVWSSPLAKDSQSPLRYIDLMNSKKPHLMIGYRNNLGKEVSLEYTPSTKYYLQDKLAGRPWVTKLHFPVHCTSKTETRDLVSGHRFVSTYDYHHGYYDHVEREFRGFGRVEQTDAEHFEHWAKGTASNVVESELHQDPVLTKSWFHTGAYLRHQKILGQFEHEYWYEEMTRAGFPAVVHPEQPLSDARIIAAKGLPSDFVKNMSSEERQQAYRACKSMALRTEIFAKDAPTSGATDAQRQKELTPFSAATHNCIIEVLQPKGQNRHAIFVVKESEAITYNYERDPTDPRIVHNLNLKLDEFGNVLESAAVVYPRYAPDGSLPQDTRDAQGKTVIIYSENQFTNDIDTHDHYRLRVPSEVKTWELKGVSKTGGGLFYQIADFENILAKPTTDEVFYHEIDKALVGSNAQKRLIEHVRSIFYKNDLTGALLLHQLESLGLPFENYQLAYTPELLNDIFGALPLPDLQNEGKFTHSEGDLNWWVRSGTTQFIEGLETAAAAQNRFFVPISYTDPFGSITKVRYDADHLFIRETEDMLGNTSRVEVFNYRTLSPRRMRDPNLNFSEVLTDELGLVKALAVFGKGAEADDLAGLEEFTDPAEQTAIADFFNASDSVDLTNRGKILLNHATARFVYDFDVFKNTGKPVVVASIMREEHFATNANSPVQLSFEYSNGLGKVAMKKVQSEPGWAKKVVVASDNTYTVINEDTANLKDVNGQPLPSQLRWLGNGRTVLNNKGNAVKQYEPYFSVTHQYEDLKELVESGVTPVLYYDAAGRLVRTDMPDGTFSKTVFDSWKQSIFDPNDTVLESKWHQDRITNAIDAELVAAGKNPAYEKQAALQAAKHADTPNTQHFDTLGRPVLSVEHNRNTATNADEFYKTKVYLDTEGNLRRVTDARELPSNGQKGNVVMTYKYDMLGQLVYQNSMDAGQRWLLTNALGKPLRTWDERNHEFRYVYDALHRPTESKILGGDPGNPGLDHIFEKIEYGELQSTPEAKNLRGQVFRHFDTGGRLEMPEYDFKGKPSETRRRLFSKYKEVANWVGGNLTGDLEADTFTFITETDALGRISKQTAPDGSVIFPQYNEGGLLDAESVAHPGKAAVFYLKNLDYNEKGQRERIQYGNDVVTKFEYDEETFRLLRLVSRRVNGDLLQDLHYTYDPTGNITHLDDKAVPQQFFKNFQMDGLRTFKYDALYRLVEATGRENDVPLNHNGKDNWHDAAFMTSHNPNDGMAMRNYVQKYQFDAVGNILQMQHQAVGNTANNWTRDYTYETMSNRLKKTQIGSTVYNYDHHAAHGFMAAMPHLEEVGWNFKEEIVRTIRQKVNSGTPETTYYQYDGQGQRIRKITENASASGNPTKKEERIYIAGYELYKKPMGSQVLERTSLSLMDEGHRFVMVETQNGVDLNTELHLVRYQLHNHLGSACLELDNSPAAAVISYEEYHPFGTTAYQARNGAIKSAAKGYRYTGMERDEESGLSYHSARYYLPWLGRWCSADPIGLGDGVNLYGYGKNNPIIFLDKGGKQSKIKDEKQFNDTHIYSSAPEAVNKRKIDLEFIGGDFSKGDQVNLKNEDYLKFLIDKSSDGKVTVSKNAKGLQFFIVKGGGEGFLDKSLSGKDASKVSLPNTTTSGAKGTAIVDYNDLIIIFDSKGKLVSAANLIRPLSIPNIWTQKTANLVYNSWDNGKVSLYRNENFEVQYYGLKVDDKLNYYSSGKVRIDMHKQEDTNGCIFICDPATPSKSDLKKINAFEPKLITDIQATLGKKTGTDIGIIRMLEIK